jgi:hypothetical protein
MNFILLVRETKKEMLFFGWIELKKKFFFFKVIASAGDENHSDIHSGEESSGSSNDYTERRSLAITIPDYSLLDVNDEKFYVSSQIHRIE